MTNTTVLQSQTEPKPFGRQVLTAFIAFFLLVIVVNSIFIYIALDSHTGVIAEKSYEKGLAYDEFLKKARMQAPWEGRPSFEEGRLTFVVKDAEGVVLPNLDVKARFIRLVQDGYDFDVALQEAEAGTYTVTPEFPLMGLWKVYLTAQNEAGETFRMSYSVQAK